MVTSKTDISIAIRYTSFALVFTFINIGSQMMFLLAYDGLYHIELSIVFGTAIAMPPRFVLEKKFVFNDKSHKFKTDGRKLLIYGSSGVLITLVFWMFEYSFHFFFNTSVMRYVGGIVGLAGGFYVKYQLDKKYVFVNRFSEVQQ